jgi:hypothetical protein
VLYRSGSPTEQGLSRLCQEGYRRVYSLYGARTTARGEKNAAMLKKGADERSCERQGKDGERHTLPWIAASSSRGRAMPQILKDVVEAARDPQKGPVLVHCWNGLHYAGMVSAMVLRQLCGASAETAEAYWWSTTSQGEHYPHVVLHIRNYRPLPGFSFTDEERKRLCPDLPKPQRRAIAQRGNAEEHLVRPATQ